MKNAMSGEYSPKGRDILSEYGRDTPKPQASVARSGGAQTTRDVMNYAPPTGPTNINDPKSVGLHGENYGMNPAQATPMKPSGSPGIGGTIHHCGSQRDK